jgi:catechol 2,3-dioxygenase-like lactoylglutathione lyase family enzyme
MTLAVRHTGIVVHNLELCLEFWCNHLGFVVKTRMDEAGPHIDAIMELSDVKVTTVKLAAADGSLVELLKFHSHPDKPTWTGGPTDTGPTHVALTVSDLDGLYERLQPAGVRFHSPPLFSPDGKVKFTYCRGPENLLLELVEVLPS